MIRPLPVFLLAATAAFAAPAAPPGPVQEPLAGSVQDGLYISPTGIFKIEVPVLRELGGSIRDSANVVTFRDNFGVHISIGAFQNDATLKWQLSTRGIRDYLIYFFGNFVMPDFKRFCADATAESAGYSADLEGGALFTYVLLPGGSMFSHDEPFGGEPSAPPVAKRGNLIFVKNGYTMVISTELAERVTGGTTYHKTPEEEDKILRQRLEVIVQKIQFTQPPQK